MSCATASFKWYMSHIVSITAGTFMTAALLFFIFSIAAHVSDISIGLILMKIWLSSHISLKVVLRWNYTFFFFFKFCGFYFVHLLYLFIYFSIQI